MDVQATLRIAEADVQTRIAAARYRPVPGSARGRAISRRLIDDNRLGRTCYLGSPKSAQMGRIYDKGRESPGIYPPGSIRYEVQTRKQMADHYRRAAQRGELSEELIARRVGGWFEERGAPLGVQFGSYEAWTWPRAPPSDYERALDWWTRCVAPTVRRFLADGTSAEIAAALGLQTTESHYDR